jgi:photosystem II stability/assembly factor-like uncharacterized protein
MRVLWFLTVGALVCVASSSIAGADTNVWTSLGPDEGNVQAIAMNPQDSNTLYAATSAGVFKTTDGGRRWNQANSGLTSFIVNGIVIDPQHPSTLYASTDDGVFKSTDAAASWNSANLGLPPFLVVALTISPQDSNTLYAGICCRSGIFKTTDGGASWNEMTTGLSGEINVLIADAKNQGTVYAGDMNGIYKTTDGGVNWTRLQVTPSLSRYFAALTIDPQDSNILYAAEGQASSTACCSYAPIFKSTDGGTTWTTSNTPIPDATGSLNNWITVLAVDPQNSLNLYAGTPGGLYKSADGAVTWNKIDAGPPGWVNALVPDPRNSGVAFVGTGSGFYKTTDGATTWSAASSGLRGQVMAIYPDPLNLGTLYVPNQAGISKSVDSGENWTTANSGLPANAIPAMAIDPQNSGTVYAGVSGGGTQSGGVFKSIDSGTSWIRSALPKGGGAQGIAIDPQAPTTLYAWNSQGLYKTTDGSMSWEVLDPGYAGTTSVVVDPHDSKLVYGFNSNGLVKSTDGGATWSPANSGFPPKWYPRALAADPLNIGTLYAWSNLYDAGGPKLFKTTDGAASWNPANSGLQGNQISSLVIDPRNTSNVYAATWGFAASSLQVTAVFASADGGEHWSMLSPALPLPIVIYGLARSPLDANLYAATSGGTYAITVAPPADSN